MRKRIDGQSAFDFDAAPIAPPTESPPERTLDESGHRWWARFGREMQEHCIGQANKALTPQEIGEWAGMAKTWKLMAAKQEARANVMEKA